MAQEIPAVPVVRLSVWLAWWWPVYVQVVRLNLLLGIPVDYAAVFRTAQRAIKVRTTPCRSGK